jgi:hypothetical protein
MHDIVDVIKNLQTLTVNDSSFKILKDFERVIDELDVYVYQGWEDGELLAGPQVGRYLVTCKFLWPENNMPDPDGAARLTDYGCKISYEKTQMMVPRKVHKPSDFRPGTKKGRFDAHTIWVVSISMPKKLMQDIYQGYKEKDSARLADLMKYDTTEEMAPESLTPEIEPNAEAPAAATPPAPTV